MKLYTEYSSSSISMSDDKYFKETLAKLFSENNIQYLIETGTYLGTGSTRTIAEAFPEHKKPIEYVSIEANFAYSVVARINLRKYSFVKVIWGNTVSKEDAIDFIKNDEVLHHHERFPDIFIDNIENPVGFYTDEIAGKLGKNPATKLISFVGNIISTPEHNVLHVLLKKYQDKEPMIILDSAGGIGFLEFQLVKEVMGNKDYWLLLDDIHHLKHFRSFEAVKADPSFSMIGYSKTEGWMLAKHTAKKN